MRRFADSYFQPLWLIVGWAWLIVPLETGAQCNTPPVANNDSALHYGMPVVIDVLANDDDGDGEALDVTIVSKTCSGTVAVDLGLVTLTTPSGIAEDCTIRYRAIDEHGDSSPAATVTLTNGALIFTDDFESGDTSAWPEEG